MNLDRKEKTFNDWVLGDVSIKRLRRGGGIGKGDWEGVIREVGRNLRMWYFGSWVKKKEY